MTVFHGVGVALLTFFEPDGSLAVGPTAEHAARLVDLGVTAVVVAGSTGEAAALDRSERTALLTAVRRAVPAGIPVLAGTGAAATRDAVGYTRDAVEHGAAAVLALSPPGVADPRAYYDTLVAAAGDVPVLAYHFPAVSPPGIAVERLGELPVAGVKDSSGDAERLLRTVEAVRGEVHTGSATLLVHAGAVGAAGAILALANVEPAACRAPFAGDGAAQRALLAAHLAARAEFPAGLKRLAAARFGTPTACRIGAGVAGRLREA